MIAIIILLLLYILILGMVVHNYKKISVFGVDMDDRLDNLSEKISNLNIMLTDKIDKRERINTMILINIDDKIKMLEDNTDVLNDHLKNEIVKLRLNITDIENNSDLYSNFNTMGSI